jgi:carbonic anhydrase
MSFKNTVISIFVIVVIALMLSGDKKDVGAHWSYDEELGPKEWASLDEKYEMCAEGLHQSPINIINSIEAQLTSLSLEEKSKAKTFVNNGHTVQVNFSGFNTLNLDNTKYYLKQIHFHTPSENQIDGKSYPMEAHLVHASSTGQLAVVAVLFEEGSENNVLNKLLRNLPENKGDKNNLKSEVLGYEILPVSKEYYKFNGSLTTPPCSEGVKWFVLRTPVQLSTSQLNDFMEVMPKNNRPIQEINARTILD